MKYRKKRVVIDAVQSTRKSLLEDPQTFSENADWLVKAIESGIVNSSRQEESRDYKLFIETLEGTMAVDPGDWIIRGTAGELYPCKPDIFPTIYDLVGTEKAERFDVDMTQYIGTKRVKGFPMTMKDYFEQSGREIPPGMVKTHGEDAPGYLVEYEPTKEQPEGYQSWSPMQVFEDAYREVDGLTFGIAIELMKAGKKLTRPSWNGKGFYVFYQKGYPVGIPLNKNTAEATGEAEGTVCKFAPYLMIQTNEHSFAIWVPSTSDVLAEDWTIVE